MAAAEEREESKQVEQEGDHRGGKNDAHLRRLLRGYLIYYHGCRTHLSLEKDAPEPRPVEHPDQGGIVEMPMVGGLHHRYTRQAA